MKTLLMMSLTGSALALLVMGLRALLSKRLHPRLIYLLWLPVLLSLVIPLRFESPISLRNAPTVQRVEQSLSARMDKPIAYGTVTPPQLSPTEHSLDGISVTVPTNEEEQAVLHDRGFGIDAYDILAVVWIVGAVITGGYITLVNLRFRGRVRRSRREIAVPWILSRQMGKMQVFVSKAVPSPCLVGVFRPFVVVTPQALEDEARLVHVLTHERMHKIQGDHIWSLLRMAVLIVHWFNPIVWIAASLSRSDCENACDALTIRALGEEQRVDYGKTLLAFLRAKPTATALVNVSTTMAQSRRQIRRRISLIAKKQRYAWIAAVFAVILTLTGCALTMTAPEESGSPGAEITPTPAPQPAPTPDSASEPAADQTHAAFEDPQIVEFMTSYESVLEPYVSAFESMTWEEVSTLLPEFADCELYGRKNPDGDTYILVRLPEVQKASAYQDVVLGVWQETHGDDELCFHVARIGTLGEPGNFTEVKLDAYELNNVLMADTIYEMKDTLIVILNGSDHVLCELHTVSAINTERFIRTAYPGAASVRPEQGAYLAVPMLNSETMQATGWHTAVTAFLPLQEDLLAGLEFESLEDAAMKDFWEDAECMTTMRLYPDGKPENYVMIGSDCLVRYEDHRVVGVCRQNVYYERFNGLVEETFGIDPFFYIHSKAFNSPENVQVKMATLSFLNYETDEILTQTLSRTDSQKQLDQLQKLVFEPDDILVGGAGCPFGGILTLQTSECEYTFHVAADSCGVLCYEGNIYLDYGDQKDLFEIFPECNPYSPTYTYTGENAPRPVTMEVLTADAAEWEVYETETDQRIQELYELTVAKMAESEGKPAKGSNKPLCELDFRDENVACILHVQVLEDSFVVDGRVYPDKKQELFTLTKSLGK